MPQSESAQFGWYELVNLFTKAKLYRTWATECEIIAANQNLRVRDYPHRYLSIHAQEN
jgi:hypothetical protein